ncbi:MAG: S66 peptidase family protein [Halobacteriaceae archaeon]
MSSFLVPEPVSPGDEVAVIAPSSGGARRAPHVLSQALDRLRNLGLDPTIYPTARQGDPFLYEHPKARAADVHAAFRSDASAVFATIGGDDQIRLLDHLEEDVLIDNPTRFFGMSDNTVLCSYLWRAGIVSYYGGQLLNQVAVPGGLPPYSERHLKRALFDPALGTLEPSNKWADLTASFDEWLGSETEYRSAEGWIWSGSDRSITGRLWGGCLMVLSWMLMANRPLPDLSTVDNAVLLLETSEEMPSADDVRCLLQAMGERGFLQQFDGAIIGRPATQNWQKSRDKEARERYRRDQRSVIREQLSQYAPDIPVVFDVDVGHTNPTVPLPIGGRCEIDTADQSIRFPKG